MSQRLLLCEPLMIERRDIQLFLCGDVMTGRGIDQIMLHPTDPALHEPVMHSARDYVQLAEKRSGPIPRAVSFSYIWGDALNELQRISPDVRNRQFRDGGYPQAMPGCRRASTIECIHPMLAAACRADRCMRASQQPCTRLGKRRPL